MNGWDAVHEQYILATVEVTNAQLELDVLNVYACELGWSTAISSQRQERARTALGKANRDLTDAYVRARSWDGSTG